MSIDSVSGASDLRGDLEACQARIGYAFHDPQLLEAALTHASGVQHRLSSNERMEFFGDAIRRWEASWQEKAPLLPVLRRLTSEDAQAPAPESGSP